MKIKVSDQEKVEAALLVVNGRASEHVLALYEIERLARDTEADLIARGILKKNLPGATVAYTPEGPGKAYSKKARTVISTSVTLTRGPKEWAVTQISRADVWATASEVRRITVSEDAKAAMIAHALRNVA